MPQNAFCSMKSRSSAVLVSPKTTQIHFFPTLHPLSQVIFATAAVVAFVLLRNSRFNFHCYTQREATPTQKSSQKWRCDLSRLLAQKITNGIHSCIPASLNRPTWLRSSSPRKSSACREDELTQFFDGSISVLVVVIIGTAFFLDRFIFLVFFIDVWVLSALDRLNDELSF